MTPPRRSSSGPVALQTVATLLSECFAARTVHEIADAVLAQVREVLPPHGRDLAWMSNLRRRLALAVREVCLSELPQDDTTVATELPEVTGAAESMRQCLASAADHMDKQSRGPLDGRFLRAAAESIVTAARGVAQRSVGNDELSAVRQLERVGAPPAMLFRLDGELLWFNSPLAHMCDRRQFSRENLRRDAQGLVRALAVESQSLGGPAASGESRALSGARTGLNLRATLRHGNGDMRSTFVEVIASEARRQTRLTPRELQVARLLAELGSYAAVAQRTDLSLDSVRTYVRRVYRKLAVNSRALLRERLIYEGLISPPEA